MEKCDWDLVTSLSNINSIYDKCISIFSNLYNKNCPLSFTLKIKNKNKNNAHSFWLNKKIKNAIKKKEKLYKDSIRINSQHNIEKYKKYRNKLNIMIRRQKNHVMHTFLYQSHNETWKKIKTLINKNSKDTIPDNLYIQDSLIDKSDRAQAFNDLFASIGSDISKSIPSVDDNSFYKYLKEPIINSFYFNQITKNDIYNALIDIKSKTSRDINGIGMNIIKKKCNLILEPLLYIFNQIIHTSTIPNQMKIAIIIPIYKNG